MKSSIFAALALTATVAAGACGGNVVVDGASTGGHGGSSTTGVVITGPAINSSVSVTSTSVSSTSVSSSSGGDPCGTGADCTACPNFYDCNMCLGIQYPKGAQLYQDAVNCILCDACYAVCEGSQMGCTAPPVQPSVCDVGMPSMPGTGACGGGGGTPGCIECSQKPGGPCAGSIQACTSDPDCNAYLNGLQGCPMN